MRFDAGAGYVAVRFAAVLLLVGAVILGDSVGLLIVLPLLLLVFVLAVVYEAIASSRDPDA